MDTVATSVIRLRHFRIWSGGGCGGSEEEEKLSSPATGCCNRKRSNVGGGGNSNGKNGNTAITIAAPVTAKGNANGDAGTMVSEV